MDAAVVTNRTRIDAKAVARFRTTEAIQSPAFGGEMHASRQSALHGSVPRVELPLCKLGNLEVRLTNCDAEVLEAQKLRYAVFYQELSAQRLHAVGTKLCDADAFDAICDHLIVIDHAAVGGPVVVGTYRLINRTAASAAGGFYSSGEYDLSPLLQLRLQDGRQPNLLELGRSCVSPAYRTSGTIMLLWRAIAAYVEAAEIDYLFGCASFPGTNPAAIGEELALLHYRHQSPIDVKAHRDVFVPMDRVSVDYVDQQKVWRKLPPLVRGYLQAGAAVGEGAFIDRQFGTIDVFMIVATDQIRDRYRSRFIENL